MDEEREMTSKEITDAMNRFLALSEDMERVARTINALIPVADSCAKAERERRLKGREESSGREVPPGFFLTERGFLRAGAVGSNTRGEVHVYESSAAEAPCVWVKVICPANLNDPHNGDTLEAHAHLTLEQARALADGIALLIDAHFLADLP